MAWCKVNNIFDVLKPFYAFSKVFGYSSFTIRGKLGTASSQMYVSVADVIMLVINAAIAFLNILSNAFIDFATLSGHSSQIFQKGIIIMSGIGFAVVFLFIMLQFVQRSIIFRAVQAIHAIDQEIYQLGVNIPFYRERNVICAFFSVKLVLVGIGAAVSLLPFEEFVSSAAMIVITVVSFSSVAIGFTIVMDHFNISLFILRQRYKALNDNFKNCFETHCDRFYVSFAASLRRRRVEKRTDAELLVILNRTAIIYDQLTDLLDIINRIFAFQMIVTFGCVFCFAVITSFGLYRLSSEVSLKIIAYSYLTVYWVVFYSIQTLVVIFLASSMSGQGRQTSLLLHKALFNTSTPAVREKDFKAG